SRSHDMSRVNTPDSLSRRDWRRQEIGAFWFLSGLTTQQPTTITIYAWSYFMPLTPSPAAFERC
ncbi:MAG: hypothetical protein ACOC2T_01965, partial [Planctomycetota bacterium]